MFDDDIDDFDGNDELKNDSCYYNTKQMNLRKKTKIFVCGGWNYRELRYSNINTCEIFDYNEKIIWIKLAAIEWCNKSCILVIGGQTELNMTDYKTFNSFKNKSGYNYCLNRIDNVLTNKKYFPKNKHASNVNNRLTFQSLMFRCVELYSLVDNKWYDFPPLLHNHGYFPAVWMQEMPMNNSNRRDRDTPDTDMTYGSMNGSSVNESEKESEEKAS